MRDAVVAALAPFVIENGKVVIERGKAALRRPFANRKNRGLAAHVARQIVAAPMTRAVIARDWYWVVWQDETPFAAYPPLPEGIGPLAERPELQNYQGIRHRPVG